MTNIFGFHNYLCETARCTIKLMLMCEGVGRGATRTDNSFAIDFKRMM